MRRNNLKLNLNILPSLQPQSHLHFLSPFTTSTKTPTTTTSTATTTTTAADATITEQLEFFSSEPNLHPTHQTWIKQMALDRTKFKRRPVAEPYKIKVVEPIATTSLSHRKQCIQAAGYNTFLLHSKDVYIDLLTDSGTSAMSDAQWAGLQLGDEAYAGSKNFFHLWDTITEHYGYRYVVPTHQGRGAEHILSQTLIKQGDVIPGNMYFTTTRLHQELAGGRFVDVIIDAAHDPGRSDIRFKGNIDLNKLKTLIFDELEGDSSKIPYLSLQACVNMAGGQPYSMENAKDVYAFCHSFDPPIRVFMDATRAVENAYFIQQFESGYEHRSIKEILLELCSYSDGCTMSGKKDSLVNIGGWVATNEKSIYDRFCEMVVVYEGLHTYGGMSGRDMEAMAIGIKESVQDEYMASRIGQVHYLGHLLDQVYKVPLVKPFGGHAIFIDAKKFLSHIPQNAFPAQSLAAELYIDSGIRSMERGIVSAGRNKKTGDHNYPKLELVRLTIPRRVYTQAHMDVVAYSVANVYQNRENITGLEFEYEPDKLRFFLAKFKKL